MFGNPFHLRVSIADVGSSTLVAADSLLRHHVTKGLVTIATVTGAAVAGIYETSAGGSTAAVFVGLWNASAPGTFSFDFGEHGIPCSSIGTRLALVLATASSTVNLNLVGYSR